MKGNRRTKTRGTIDNQKQEGHNEGQKQEGQHQD